MGYLIETERLGLNPVDPEDDLSVYLDWLRDPLVTRFLENRFFPTTIVDLRSYVKGKQYATNALLLGVFIKDNLSLVVNYPPIVKHRSYWIGNIKLEPVDYIHRRGEIGIMIGDTSSWNKGYATEAIGGLVKYCFHHLGLRRLTAGCYEQNIGSLKAFESNGFVKEGKLREHIWCEGSLHDEILLGLLEKDWKLEHS